MLSFMEETNLRLMQHTTNSNGQRRQSNTADDGRPGALRIGNLQRTAHDSYAAKHDEISPAKPCHALDAMFEGCVCCWDEQHEVDC